MKAYVYSDTLIICEGDSIQLSTIPNQISYTWTSDGIIDNKDIHNPVVSPNSTTIYYVNVEPSLENLVFNGDFSDGNVGFSSDYTYTTESTYAQGHYAIFTSPTQFNNTFGDCNDHSSSSDELMLVADGATIPDENVWCQTIDVLPFQTYNFSAWITNIHPTAPSLLQFSINGVLLGAQISVEEDLCVWTKFAETWYSDSNREATICITNQNTISFGNDFAIDDISFRLNDNVFIDTFTVVVLENSITMIDTAICANEFILHEGIMVPADTQMVFNYTAFNGCDSFIQYNVESIDTSYTEIRVDTLCPGDSIFYMGALITKDTSICQVNTNVLGCDSSFCFVAYFLSEATIEINAVEPNCERENNGSILANPFAGCPPFEYQWNTGAVTNMISNLSSGIYNVTVTDAKFCIAEKTIELLEPPPMNLTVDLVEPSCYGGEDGHIILNVTGGIPLPGNEYSIVIDDQEPTSENVFTEMISGNYDISILDANLCFIDTIIFLPEPNPIGLTMPSDTNLQLGCFVDLNVEISADFNYEVQWTPAFNLDCTSCERPRASPVENVIYKLSVVDEWGCDAADSVSIKLIKYYEVYIPNAFSPNNDGVNDFFEIYAGKDVEEILSFSVYDRWGTILFEATDFFPNDMNSKWNGIFKNQPLTPGVFIYLAKVRFKDGVEKVFGGDVTLME